MENPPVIYRARLHPLEIATPLAVLFTFLAFTMPNYLSFAPGAALDQASARIGQLIVAARRASVDSGRARLVFDAGKRQVVLTSGRPGSEKTEGTYSLPGGVRFGYDQNVTPYPGLKLPNGTDLAATENGITFDNDTLVMEDGLLTGFPGLVYLRNDQGQVHAIYVRISGDYDLKAWQSGGWTTIRN
ncbi:MAG: hypothetical protein KIT79_10360 [Deltaproteobacteria bacterium]|nr:hypothetical protein [Deltaproteobacteria bacterium]